jgi:hypothetical protein
MSKFQFPALTSQDEKIVREYCKLMEYEFLLNRKKKIAKIKAFEKSLYIVKAEVDGSIALLATKTSFDKQGNLVYDNPENIYLKYKEAVMERSIFGKELKGKILYFYRAIYGLAFFLKNELSLCEYKQQSL